MNLFSNYQLGDITLKNRIVMAPMTRCRAINNIPNDLMAKYYSLRADAGLIITEGTAASKDGLGYARIPGLFTEEQIAGWKKVTSAVHAKGGKIFVQMMQTGRVSHPDNMPEGARVLAPSAVPSSGEMWTDKNGMQPYPTPVEMTLEDIAKAQDEYVYAAQNAIKAGFDGVELHGANGYLIDQFINTQSNKRTDEYGGSVENRTRFAIEVATKVANAIGPNKTAMRLSPYGVFNNMEIFDTVEQTYVYLASELKKINLVYLHLVDHSGMGSPEVPMEVKNKIRKAFSGTIILCGGYDKEKAEKDLTMGNTDLVGFGKPFIANADLVERIENNWDLNQPDFNSFYTADEKGYTDYELYSSIENVK